MDVTGNQEIVSIPLQGSGLNDHPPLWCDLDSNFDRGSWNVSSSLLLVRVCANDPQDYVAEFTEVSLAFVLQNPSDSQSSPFIVITARDPAGRALISQFPMQKPSQMPPGTATQYGQEEQYFLSGYADPMNVINAGFTRKIIHQSSCFTNTFNTITVTLQSSVDIYGGSPFSAYSSSLQTPAFQITPQGSLDGINFSDTPVLPITGSAAQIFCSGYGQTSFEHGGYLGWDYQTKVITMYLCTDQTIVSGESYVFSFNFTNPSLPRESPTFVLSLVQGISWVSVSMVKPPAPNNPLLVVFPSSSSSSSHSSSSSSRSFPSIPNLPPSFFFITSLSLPHSWP